MEILNVKKTSSVHDLTQDKPPFGSRFLTDDTNVWSQNAWDHVPPPDDQDEIIAASLQRQQNAPVPECDKPKYNNNPSRHWDNFYKANDTNFFRNRKWLHNEFPELVKAAEPDAGAVRIIEVGCGAGNAVFPLLSANCNPLLALSAHDYSSHAVKLVQNNPLYTKPPCGSISASVWDLTSPSLPDSVEAGSVDIVVLIFVLSALHPDEWSQAINNIHTMLKPGGLVVFRDYGRYDLTQLRFKANRLLDKNLYVRGDKTRVYFFTLDELALLFSGSRADSSQTTTNTATLIDEGDDEDRDRGVSIEEAEISEAGGKPILPTPPPSSFPCSPVHPNLLASSSKSLQHPLFEVVQLGVDRRLVVNRKRQLKMYRVWMQGKFRRITPNA